MEMEQEREWAEAQKIVVSVDLVAAAKQQLQFLAAVDRNRCLYGGPVLQRAIYRYNACWLPLLAKHSKNPIFEGPLVVPLDCEWIWHCHRLNPVQYKSDCEKLFGRVLDNCNAVSSVQGTSKKQTEEIWNTMYLEEPYDLDLTRAVLEDISQKNFQGQNFTKYDLVSAVARQSPFFYQVSRPHMGEELFLQEAVARYKGFLHLIKRNKEKSIARFCVPTYDIDLIWHSHQLHPESYCQDLTDLLGKVLEHDDMDSDRAKGKKLDLGFSGTTQQWEDIYGFRYWRAGAMYRGSSPAPVTETPSPFTVVGKQLYQSHEGQKLVQLPKVKVMEAFLEVVAVKNVPEGHKGSLSVSFRKKQPDMFFNATRRLSILSVSGEKQVACFHCEPTGELLLELISHSPSNLAMTKRFKAIGSTSLSLQELLDPVSKLSMERWLELVPSSGTTSSKPTFLRVALSVTIPTEAPQVLHMVRSQPLCKSSCFFPLPGRIQHAKSCTRVIDESGNDVISLQMRDSRKQNTEGKLVSAKEVVGITESGENHILAEFVGNGWHIKGTCGAFLLQRRSGDDRHLFDFMGDKMLNLFTGRKLEYETKHCGKGRNEQDFVTAVEFSAENPYGRAAALIDLRSGIFEVKDEWLVLPGITLAFILSDILRKEGYNAFSLKGGNLKMDNSTKNGQDEATTVPESVESEVGVNAEVAEGDATNLMKSNSRSGGCGGGCGSGCGGGVWQCSKE
ncbi:hypothetical protein Ancab_003626 [Ancistrocladus abbreviatus]